MSEERKELIVNDRRHHVSADAAPATGGSLMETLASAVQRGLPIETLNALMDFQERHEAAQARKSFDAAMAEAKKALPVIIKNRAVDFTSQKGRTHYKHEDLASIARAVDPILARHGLSYRFNTVTDKEGVTVTCIVSHRDGHSETNTLIAGHDNSGNKNSIQAIGSTITYLQRYTLKAALGLAASHDDDGAGQGDEAVDPQEEAAPLLDMIDQTPREELGGLNGKIKKEAETRKLSAPAFNLVKAHYSARIKREKEMASA